MTDDKLRVTKEQRDLFASIDNYRIGNLLHDLELVERQRDEARAKNRELRMREQSWHRTVGALRKRIQELEDLVEKQHRYMTTLEDNELRREFP